MDVNFCMEDLTECPKCFLYISIEKKCMFTDQALPFESNVLISPLYDAELWKITMTIADFACFNEAFFRPEYGHRQEIGR